MINRFHYHDLIARNYHKNFLNSPARVRKEQSSTRSSIFIIVDIPQRVREMSHSAWRINSGIPVHFATLRQQQRSYPAGCVLYWRRWCILWEVEEPWAFMIAILTALRASLFVKYVANGNDLGTLQNAGFPPWSITSIATPKAVKGANEIRKDIQGQLHPQTNRSSRRLAKSPSNAARTTLGIMAGTIECWMSNDRKIWLSIASTMNYFVFSSFLFTTGPIPGT
jgi:hypothetical protein